MKIRRAPRPRKTSVGLVATAASSGNKKSAQQKLMVLDDDIMISHYYNKLLRVSRPLPDIAVRDPNLIE